MPVNAKIGFSRLSMNEKTHHHWSQSVSGMSDVVGRFSEPEQVVCDPFVGGGTTAVACAQLKRYFIGGDIDADCVRRSTDRLNEALI